ncbi:MAG: 1,3-beta-galactosyl-N-acetylhexosamine phosphorylase N-terminal domain-containing protein [Roseburia inulinivorans]
MDQGYHNSMFRVPSREFKDFIEFQQQEVCALAKELVDIVHSYGKEAMMFLGDHWIGTEPYGKYFAGIGLDAVVGSVGSGVTLRYDFRYTRGEIYRRKAFAIFFSRRVWRRRRSHRGSKGQLDESEKGNFTFSA